MSSSETLKIPAELLPRDGRFGSGPSKVRPEQLSALVADGTTYMGTSHRQSTVRDKVGEVRDGLRALFSLARRATRSCSVTAARPASGTPPRSISITDQSQHLSFGEFSSKFATCVTEAPHLKDPQIIKSDVGSHPMAVADDSVDTYALTHNETSTGVMMYDRASRRREGPRHRRRDVRRRWSDGRRVAVRLLLLRAAEVVLL